MIFNIELVSLYLCVALAASSSVLAAPTPSWSGADDGDVRSMLARRLGQLDSASAVPHIGLMEPPMQPTQVCRHHTVPSTPSLQDEVAQVSSSTGDEGAQAMEQESQILMRAMRSGTALLAPAVASQKRHDWDWDSLDPFLTDGRFDGSADTSNSPMLARRFDASDLQFGQTADFIRQWSAGHTGERRQASDSSLQSFVNGNGQFGSMYGVLGIYEDPASSHRTGPPSHERRYDAGDLQFGQTADLGRSWSWPSDGMQSLRFDGSAVSTEHAPIIAG